jgi:hypothetical protein
MAHGRGVESGPTSGLRVHAMRHCAPRAFGGSRMATRVWPSGLAGSGCSCSSAAGTPRASSQRARQVELFGMEGPAASPGPLRTTVRTLRLGDGRAVPCAWKAVHTAGGDVLWEARRIAETFGADRAVESVPQKSSNQSSLSPCFKPCFRSRRRGASVLLGIGKFGRPPMPYRLVTCCGSFLHSPKLQAFSRTMSVLRGRGGRIGGAAGRDNWHGGSTRHGGLCHPPWQRS